MLFCHSQKLITNTQQGKKRIGPRARFWPYSVATETVAVTPMTTTDLAYAVLSRSEAWRDCRNATGISGLAAVIFLKDIRFLVHDPTKRNAEILKKAFSPFNKSMSILHDAGYQPHMKQKFIFNGSFRFQISSF